MRQSSGKEKDPSGRSERKDLRKNVKRVVRALKCRRTTLAHAVERFHGCHANIVVRTYFFSRARTFIEVINSRVVNRRYSRSNQNSVYSSRQSDRSAARRWPSKSHGYARAFSDSGEWLIGRRIFRSSDCASKLKCQYPFSNDRECGSIKDGIIHIYIEGEREKKREGERKLTFE